MLEALELLNLGTFASIVVIPSVFPGKECRANHD
jgi:hypothetical protein